MMDINVDLLQWLIFFDKKASSGTIKCKIRSNQQLAKELYLSII